MTLLNVGMVHYSTHSGTPIFGPIQYIEWDKILG